MLYLQYLFKLNAHDILYSIITKLYTDSTTYQRIKYHPKTTFHILSMFYIEHHIKEDQGKKQHSLFV